MNTPICDFVRQYAQKGSLRLHMPGHKGKTVLGPESLDITEIPGADSLYEARGIIRQSEDNASGLFGMQTLYSAEGSSLAIRAMLYLACLHARNTGRPARIAAGRNAHKTFLSAAALLDLDVMWLQGRGSGSYLSCDIDAESLEQTLQTAEVMPCAVYLTSPDYLGHVLDIAALSRVCRKYGVLLLVDNAHGAYLKFLPQSRHPVDLGADACCDSAHKTLPVLTGGAYLHIADRAPQVFKTQARTALALFGSTSPSYLILQSLDAANVALAGEYPRKLAEFLPMADSTRQRLKDMGYGLMEQEPLKITIHCADRGYSGYEMDGLLAEKGIVSEFADPELLVLMLTPDIGGEGLAQIEAALASIPAREPLPVRSLAFEMPQRVMSVRQAVFSPGETIPASESAGRVLAVATVGCPPAVPIVVSGERIPRSALPVFAHYGIETCTVIKENSAV